MSSIREFENVLKQPRMGEHTEEEERARIKQNEAERSRMMSAEGEVTPRLRHHEQQHQEHHGVEKPTPPPEETGSSSIIDDDKVKMLKEKGSEAKKAFQSVVHKGQSNPLLKWLFFLIGSILALLFVGILTMLFAKMTLPYPSHASCQVNITFYNDQFLKTTPICDAVKSAFVHQMKKWESKENCANGGMKCLYKVTHVGDDVLTGTHKTSDWFGFTDEITFKFKDTAQGDCFVEAFSRSTVPFAYFDFSVNYCNIHNLVEGYGFERYDEMTSDEVCTQYSTHDCEKY